MKPLKWGHCFPSVPPGLDGAGSTEDVTVVRGNSASLLCVADGSPTPSVSWLKDAVTLTPDLPDLDVLNQNTTVQILRARVNDTGRYTCVADNAAGRASRRFNVKVLGEWKAQSEIFDVRVLATPSHVGTPGPSAENAGQIQASPAEPRGGAVTMWTYTCMMCIYVKSRPRHVNYMWIRCVLGWFALAAQWRYD